MKQDDATTIQELKDLVAQFCDERGWAVHHTPKNLAMSIAIEAAELMEHFQWDEYSKNVKGEVAAELADVLIYCFNLANTLGIDIATAYQEKLERARRKYPLSAFSPGHDDPADYARIKKAYRAKKEKP